MPDPFAGLQKLARLSRLPEELGVAAPPPPKLTIGVWTEPAPGETCEWCRRPMERTPLEIWLAQQGRTFGSLAAEISQREEVLAFMATRPSGPRPIAKNLVWRLNHQAPGWTPRPSTPGSVVLAAMLEITGLKLEDLQNLKPTSNPPAYACGDWAVE